ncbi:MAG TPA: geranylgeranyl reductase family protein [Chloroflexota bacterium]|nr:geranylgeranyl reductase family protein [Chloroflexota bacterium]
MQYDVIVSGAGPAGSTVARECAILGLTVALLDKAEFPRDKPCGGGVNLRTARLLPFDLTPVVERTIHGMRISPRRGSVYVRRSRQPLTYLTQRHRLDAFLLERAVDSGVRVFEKAPVRAVERHARLMHVTAGAQSISGRVLVAADGANGPSASLAGLAIRRWTMVGIEGNVPLDGSPFPEQWSDAMGIDFRGIRHGYAWLFPKDDHLNIGLAGMNLKGALRERLHGLARTHGFDPRGLWGIRGHPLPVRRPESPLIGDRVLAVGDAAGLVDPFTGEGIYAAIRSGQIAAGWLAGFCHGDPSALDGYRSEVERELGRELHLARRIHDLFHLAPWFWAETVRLPMVWRMGCGILRGDQTYIDMTERAGPLGSALSRLYRALQLTSSDFHPSGQASARGLLRYAC